MSNEVAQTIQETAEVVAKTAEPAQKVVNVATKTFFKVAGKVKRFSPEILLVGGVAAVTTGAILACRATLKLESVVEKAEQDIQEVKNRRTEEYYETEVDYNKALTKVYLNRTFQVAKLYTPALSVGLVGISCLVGSHGVMTQRNVASIAAYKSLESGFEQYRRRVTDELGEDKEREIRLGITNEEVPQLNAEGEQIGVQNQEIYNGLGGGYARVFDETNDDWSKIPGQNQMHLLHQQRYLNDQLNAHGFLFLNDVYDALSFPKTEAGQVVGWLSQSHPNFDGTKNDGFIDFGLGAIDTQNKRDFINAYERSVWLDFNVDGIMHNLI
jgi:hypothetical protein